MTTLRKAYHDIGNDLHSITVISGVIKDLIESSKENPNDQELITSIARNSGLIEKKIMDADKKISDLRKVIYRLIDPDIDIQVHLEKIKEENKKIKIFIVDDEQIITEELRKKHEADGYTIDFALDGEEALKKIPDFEPNIIMTDLHLPGAISGVDIVKYVKKNTKWVQILVVSRVDDENVIKELNDLGVEWILTKPVRFADINAKLSGMIQTLKR